MRPALVPVLISVLTLSAGCSVPSSGEATQSGAPSPPAVSTTRSPSPTAEPVAPRVSGQYTGNLTVTLDTNRMNSESTEGQDLSGTQFQRTVTLGGDCDRGDVCTATHESLWVYDTSDHELWETPLSLTNGPGEVVTATFTEQFDDDCVDDDGTVIGVFHTTATTTVVLREPRANPPGDPVWTVAEMTYQEDSLGEPEELGCYTSNFAVEGVLTR